MTSTMPPRLTVPRPPVCSPMAHRPNCCSRCSSTRSCRRTAQPHSRMFVRVSWGTIAVTFAGLCLAPLAHAGTPTHVKTCSVAVPNLPAPDGSCGLAQGTSQCGPKAPTDSTYTQDASGKVIWAAYSTLNPASAVMDCTTQAWTTLAALTPAETPVTAPPVVTGPTGQLTVTCTPPTTYTDGSAIPALVSLTYALYGAPTGQPKVPVSASLPACSSVQTVTAGTWCYEASATAAGQTSAHTPEVCAQAAIAPLTPSAPGTPTVTAVTTSTIAYTVIMGADKLVPLIVGTAPLGTVCDASQPVLAYHVIPRARVTFTSALRPTTTVALCGG